MAGLGAAPFGSSAFAASVLPVMVDSVRISSLSAVDIYCDPESVPTPENPWRIDSIYYWKNWVLTAEYPITATVALVRSVTWDPVTSILRVTFDRKLQPLALYLLQCLVTPIEVRFTGIGAFVESTKRSDRDQIIQDWAKPERAADTQGGAIGTTQIVNGDLALTSGAASLHERVVRRVSTVAGEMAHDPTYGLEWRQKGLLTIDLLQRIQSRLVAAIRGEPDVVNAQVSVAQVLDAPGVVSISVRADTVDGPVDVATRIGRA